jgi:hypothetical protein
MTTQRLAGAVMRFRAAVFLIAASVAAGGAGQALAAAAVPFVGCPSDGQLGPQPAPKTTSQVPQVVGPGEDQLAYYASGDIGVLAPRGWHCVSLIGSNGVSIFVTPEPHTGKALLADTKLEGPAIQLSYIEGETSGRFAAARIDAVLFPGRRKFVDGVIAEGVEPRRDFHFGPYPHDKLARLGADLVEFETPAGEEGLGEMSRLANSSDPISGLAVQTGENGVAVLDVRVPMNLRALVPTILASTRRQIGLKVGG